MAAPRLSDSQKIEIVARYRAGEGSTELAEAYGCSANTVSRAVKAALEPTEYQQLKQQRSPRAAKAAPQLVEPVSPEPPASPQPASPIPVAEDSTPDEVEPADAAEAAVLAIDDADDFGDDASDAADADADLDFGDDDASEASDPFMAVPVLLAGHQGEPAQCQPLAEAPLPASVYMLVDKTVELQPKPLAEFTELGSLPEEEQALQALMLYTNPRQAKRQCGRTQRVIKVPDAGVLERRSSYLVAQGITRLVVEGGALFSLATN